MTDCSEKVPLCGGTLVIDSAFVILPLYGDGTSECFFKLDFTGGFEAEPLNMTKCLAI
jgi:hypothetical protein